MAIPHTKVRVEGCLCGSGTYCHLHKAYNITQLKRYVSRKAMALDDWKKGSQVQPCGGGRRIKRYNIVQS